MLQQSLQDQIEFAKDEAHHIMHYIPTISIAMDILGYWTHKGNSVEFGFRAVQWNVVKFQAFTSRDWTNMDEPGVDILRDRRAEIGSLKAGARMTKAQHCEKSTIDAIFESTMDGLRLWLNRWLSHQGDLEQVEQVEHVEQVEQVEHVEHVEQVEHKHIEHVEQLAKCGLEGIFNATEPQTMIPRAHTHTGSQHQPTSL